MSEPTPQQSEAILQARARAQRLAQAFTEVFGQPKTRTAPQRLVLEHLEAQASEGGNIFRFDGASDGFKTALAAAHRDGAQSILRIVQRQLSIEGKTHEPKKPKPATTR